MSKPTNALKYQFIPFPKSGVNLVSDPTTFLPTEAIALNNYYIYDWGIRERGPYTEYSVPDGGIISAQYPYTNSTHQGILCSSSGGHVYKLTSTGFSAAIAGGNYFVHPCGFNKKIFMVNSGTNVSSFDIATETLTFTAFTLSNTSLGCFSYRNRLYFINIGSSIEYGGVAAVSGAIAGTFDFGQVFQRGVNLIFGTSWSYNQGFDNNELMVVANDAGEVLVYSGTYPGDSATWTLIARVDIPAILGLPASIAGTGFVGSFTKLGQDILINTARGVLSLSKIIAGRSSGAQEANNFEFYSISRRLGPAIIGGLPAVSQTSPFAYFSGQDAATGDGVIFVLNYELGAWSTFDNLPGSFIYCSCSTLGPSAGTFLTGPLGFTCFSSNNSKVYLVFENDTTNDSTASYVWGAPYNRFNTPLQKEVKTLRVIGRNLAGSGNFSNKIAISVDYNSDHLGTYTSASKAAVSGKYIEQELSPAGVGASISCYFNKVGDGTSKNEIAGVGVFYTEGGVY